MPEDILTDGYDMLEPGRFLMIAQQKDKIIQKNQMLIELWGVYYNNMLKILGNTAKSSE